MDSVGMQNYPPSFTVTSTQIPEIENWKVGGKYKMVVSVEQKHMSENDDNVVTGSFEVTGYKVLKDKTMEEMSDKEFGEYEGDLLSGKKKLS